MHSLTAKGETRILDIETLPKNYMFFPFHCTAIWEGDTVLSYYFKSDADSNTWVKFTDTSVESPNFLNVMTILWRISIAERSQITVQLVTKLRIACKCWHRMKEAQNGLSLGTPGTRIKSMAHIHAFIEKWNVLRPT